jgi:hypothetical protein
MSSELPAQEIISDEIFNDENRSIPDWHLAVLEERMARYGVHFPDGKPWEDLEKELMQEIVEEIRKRKN